MTNDPTAELPLGLSPDDPMVPTLLAAGEAPDDDATWDAAERLAADLGRPDEVAALYAAVMARDVDAALGVHLGERAVRFHGEWFEDPAPLAVVLGRVIELDPTQTWAFDRLSMLLTVAERWADLLALYDRVLPVTTDPARLVVLLNEAAHAAKDFAGDADRAIRYLGQLSAQKPLDLQVASSLERLLEREQRHADLVRFWDGRIAHSSHDAAQVLRARIATCQLEHLGDAAGALAAALPLLEEAAHEGLATTMLGAISSSPKAPEEARTAALDALTAHHAAAGRPKDVARALEAALPVASTAAKPGLHRRIADLYRELDEARRAVDHLAALVVLAPDDDAARDELRGLAEGTGALDAFARAVAEAADASGDVARAAALRAEAGRTHEEELRDAQGAIALYLQVFRGEGATDELALDVARRLRRLLDEEASAADLLDVLERLAVLEPEEGARREALGVAARLAERTGDANRALGLWRRRLDADAADREALDAVVGLLERARRYEPLIKALESRAAAALDDRERREDLVAIATIQAEKLDAAPEAIEAWRAVERAFGPDAESTDALEALLGRVGRWAEVADLLDAASAREDDTGRRAGALHRLGDVCVDRLQDLERGTLCYEAALSIDPGHEGAREGLSRLLDDATCRETAAHVLATAYGATDDWAGTLRILEHRLATATGTAAKTTLLLEAAKLAEHRAGDGEAAVRHLARALPLSPDDAALEGELLRLARDTGGWAVVADAYREALPLATAPERRAAMHHQHGIVLESQLGDARGALEAYLAMAALAPESLDAAESSVRVAARAGRWEIAAQAAVDSARARGRVEPALVTELEAAADGSGSWDEAARAVWSALGAADTARGPEAEVVREVGMLVAAWHRDRRHDAASAERTLVETIDRAGASVPALSDLADLQRRAPGRALVDTLLALADAGHEPLGSVREAAEVALVHVDRALAAQLFERLFAGASSAWLGGEGDAAELEEHASHALERLVSLSVEDGDHAHAMARLVDGSKLPFSPAGARALTHRAASIAAVELGDGERAIALYRSILEGAPDDEAAIERLGALYLAAERLDDLVGLRRHQIELTRQAAAPAEVPSFDDLVAYAEGSGDAAVDARLGLRLDIAALLGRTGDLAGRVEALRENLAERPGHRASVTELDAVLSAAGQHGALCDRLSEQAGIVEERGLRDEARVLWERVGELAEVELVDPPRAIEARKRAVALGETPASLDALARLHVARGQHAAAVGWLERRAAIAERHERAAIAAALARAHVASGHADRGRSTLEEALANEPAARALRADLAGLYRTAEAWEDLVRTLRAGAVATTDVPSKLAYLREAAEVELSKRKSPESAIPLLEEATALEPTDRASRAALANAMRETGRLDDAHALLTKLVDEFGRRRPPERAELHYRLAQVARARGDAAEARVQLEAATAMDVGYAAAFRALGDLYRDEAELEKAERAYRALLLIVLRRAREPGEASGASEVLLELYRIAKRLDRADRAAEVLASAFDAAGESDAESRIFEKALVAAGERELLLRALDGRLARAEGGPGAAGVLSEIGDVHEALGHAAEALDARLRALGHAPDAAGLHGAARLAAARADAAARYEATLVELADRARDGGESELACQLYVRLGEVREADLDAKEAARDAYQSAEATGTAPVAVFRALDRLAVELGDRDGQIRALRQIVVNAEDGDRGRQSDDLYRLAAMELAAEETLDQGIDTLVWALDHDARNDEAARLLEGAARLRADATVLGLYERVARAADDKARLLDALERTAKLEGATVELLREATDLASDLGEAARKEALLLRMVEVAEAEGNEAGAAFALGALGEHAEQAGDLTRAVGFLRRAADHADPEEARRTRLHVAALAAGPLGDLELAIATYEPLAEHEPGEKAIWEPMLEAYRRRGDAEALEARLALVIDNVFEVEDRIRLRLERAKLLFARGDRDDDAMVVLREVLDDDPGHDEAGDLLIAACERLGRDEALAELLARRLDVARERKVAASIEALSLRIAALHGPSRPEDAKDLLRAALADAGDTRALIEALLALLQAEDDATERADLLERLLAFETGPAARERAIALADAREAIGDERGVERALETAFRAQPDDEATRERLRRFYDQHGRYAQLAGLVALEASLVHDPAQAAARLREAAAIHRDKLGDPRAAARELGAALERTPGDLDLATEHARCLAAAGEHEAAVGAVAAALAPHAPGSAERISLLRLRAELFTGVGDEPSALGDLEAAFAEAPAEIGAELVAALERQRANAAAQGDAASERGVTMRLCDVANALGNPDRALELLSDWVARAPEDVDALRSLLGAAEARERWEDAAALADRLVRLEQGEGRVAAVLRLCDAAGRAGMPDAAREALELVHAEQPGDPRLHGPLEAIYERQGAHRELAALCLARAGLATEKEPRFTELRRAGQLYLHGVREAGPAIEALLAARELKPEDHEATVLLADAYIAAGLLQEATTMLTEAVAAHRGRRSREVAVLQQRVARVAYATGDRSVEIAWLNAALDSDKQNAEVATELADAAMATGDLEVALKALRAITSMRGVTQTQRAVALLRQGQIAQQQGDVRRAILMAKKAQAEDPELAEAATFLAEIGG